MTLTRIGVFLIASPLMLIQLIMGLGVATLGATMANMLVQLWLTNLLGDSGFFSGIIRIGVFVLLYLVAWVTVAVLWAQMHRLDTLFRKDRGDSHGSARFASKAERKTFQSEDGLLIGRDIGTGKLMRYDGPAHLLTLAPTRAGKGVGTVIPNLLTVPRSVLVIDPKGENAKIAGDARKRFGAVHILDPFGVTGLPASAYNPLGRLDADSLDLGEDAASLSEALVMDPPGQQSDAHWNEEAKALLSGLIMFAVAHEDQDRKTLATVREYLTLPPEKFHALLELMQESAAAGGLIARAANRFLGKSDREAASVMSSAQRHTHFLDSPRIVAATARSDFQFSALRHDLTSIFLVLPPNRLDAYSRWLRLLVAQALQDIARDAEAAQAGAQRLKQPALFLLDEFAALGRLEAVERAMGLMAGYGLQLWPILQDMSQLRDLYGARANTFVANAGVLQTFGVNDFETAKWLSQSMGKETIGYQTESHRPGDITTTTQHIAARDLMTPDEIMQIDPSVQLLRVQGKPVIIAKKLRYFADREFDGLYLPPNAQPVNPKSEPATLNA
ncbi:type IV secretory system conjugative DNA transfer family protein [Gemmobacter fulvus]|uniref:type IV secretory system conjugative DNA transfer family protein n=1 Tax=Gemmobacter fulvus TaxID=2840474 RepID=UPI002796AB14|nr:type IV secretory system conjugative DNA transfer family protein [Gemmobacter fulvus]MDQ1850721.1 type IV secretory system conjugative DNA transfer family protein [Gemmobacter fulvus]